jgi:hypothetical protein
MTGRLGFHEILWDASEYGDEGMIGMIFDNMHEIMFIQLSW